MRLTQGVDGLKFHRRLADLTPFPGTKRAAGVKNAILHPCCFSLFIQALFQFGIWSLKERKVEFWSGRHVPPLGGGMGGGALAAAAGSNLAISSLLLDPKRCPEPYYSSLNVMRKFVRLKNSCRVLIQHGSGQMCWVLPLWAGGQHAARIHCSQGHVCWGCS